MDRSGAEWRGDERTGADGNGEDRNGLFTQPVVSASGTAECESAKGADWTEQERTGRKWIGLDGNGPGVQGQEWAFLNESKRNLQASSESSKPGTLGHDPRIGFRT